MTVRPESPQTDPGWIKNMRAAEDAEAHKRFRRPTGGRRPTSPWMSRSTGVVSPFVKPERDRWRIEGDFLAPAGLFYFWPGSVQGPSRFKTAKVGIREQRAGKLQVTKEPDGRIKVVLYD
jgi:hypothetical protein